MACETFKKVGDKWVKISDNELKQMLLDNDAMYEMVATKPNQKVSKLSVAKAPTAELVGAPSITETEAKTLKQEKINEVQDAEIKRALEDEEARIRRAAEKIQKADELQGEFIDNVSDYKESVIADNMGRVTEQSFKDFSDKNNITPAIREAYFSKPNAKIPTTIDQLAREMSDLVGLEITTKDIVDFMNKYPDGVGSRRGNKDKKTFYAENNPRDRRDELLAEAEVILGYALDEEGMERFNNEVEKLQNDLADINARPISDKDIDALSQEYDEYFNTLTDEQKRQELAKQRIEGEQIVEGAEDANRKAIQERDARQQEAKRAEERAKQEPVVEGVETIDDRIAKKLAELKERKKGKFYSGLDFENLDLYTELAYLYIRKGVKSAADFAKEIGENLSEAIKKAWDNANANVKAETENFNKWKDYAKRQFEAEDGSLEFQEFKARFNKRFNVAADDVALVEIFSEAQSEYNAERGKSVSRKEVDKSFKPERKKVEVDEKAALKDQIRLEAKAAKEGAKSVTDAIKAIVKYVNDMSNRGNLTRADLTKIMNLIPNVKDQKTLDTTADKIYDIIDKADSDVIEVSERKALLAQIKLEAKAAKEGFREARKQQQSFADRIKAFLDSAEVKGKLSPAQVKSLINRASNIKTELQLDRFVEYAEKVIDNVNYDAEMKSVSDLQKKARRRNHVSFNSAVKEFATINPENIPTDLLPKYIAALNDLANGVPNYKKMQDIFYEITQYKKQPKPFENVTTFRQAESALQKALSIKIDSIEQYKELLKNIKAFNKKVNQLYESGDITEQEYNDLLDTLARDRKAFDDKFGAEVEQLKTSLLKEALDVTRTKEYKDAVASVESKTDKELLFDFSTLSSDDLKRLSPEQLSDLSDILQNVADGFIDHMRLRDIVSDARGLKRAIEVSKQVEVKAPTVTSVDTKLKELSKEESAFREGELGLGKAKAGAVTKNIYDPLMSAIEKANAKTQKGVAELQKIFGKADRKSRLRMGIVANMLQEYMAQFNPKFANVENIGNRDWVKDVFDNNRQSFFKSEKEANEVAEAWQSLSKGATISKPLFANLRGKVAKISGNAILPKDVYDSFMANDGKYLTKEEGAALAKWFEYADKENAELQKAANEMSGDEFNRQPFYMPRLRQDADATIDDDAYDVSVNEKTNRISINSPFGKSRVSQDISPINYDIVQVGEKAISNANRDYELTKALQEVNRTIKAATTKANEALMSVITKDIKQSLVNQYGNVLKSDTLRKLQNLRSTMIQLNPLKTIKEFAATVSSMPLRGGTPQGYIEIFKQGGMKDILEYVGSPLAERLNVNQQFQLTEGEIKKMNPLQKMAYYLGGSPEMLMMKSVYMPTFLSEFKAETGLDFDIEKFRSGEKYKSDNFEAIRKANAVATNEVQKIIGSGSRFGARREIKVPFSQIDANTPTGQIVSFMGGYPYREQKEFWNGFKEVGERAKAGEGARSIGSLRKPLAVGINLLVYAYMGQMVKTLAAQVKGDEEEKKKEDELKEKFTEQGLAKTIVGQAINLLSAKFGAVGSTISKTALAIAAYNTNDEKVKTTIKEVAKENFYGMSPDLDKILSKNKYVASQAVAKYIGDLIPAIGVLSEGIVSSSGVAMDIVDITKKVANNESLTKDEEDYWKLANTAVNTLHLILMGVGGGLPSYYDIKGAIEGNMPKDQTTQSTTQRTPATRPITTKPVATRPPATRP